MNRIFFITACCLFFAGTHASVAHADDDYSDLSDSQKAAVAQVACPDDVGDSQEETLANSFQAKDAPEDSDDSASRNPASSSSSDDEDDDDSDDDPCKGLSKKECQKLKDKKDPNAAAAAQVACPAF